MAPVDWILLALLVLSLLIGAWRGLVFEVLSLLAWVAAFFAAQWFAEDVAAWLPIKSMSGTLRYAAGFVLTFIAAMLVTGLLAALVKKLVEAVGLRTVDRALGAGFGLLRGALLVLVIAAVVGMTPMKDSSWWQESQGAKTSTAVLDRLKPVLPEQFARYLN
ncbi:MAG: CvpA family protein [Pseudomonadota bacterium]